MYAARTRVQMKKVFTVLERVRDQRHGDTRDTNYCTYGRGEGSTAPIAADPAVISMPACAVILSAPPHSGARTEIRMVLFLSVSQVALAKSVSLVYWG